MSSRIVDFTFSCRVFVGAHSEWAVRDMRYAAAVIIVGCSCDSHGWLALSMS
jgi:hypothetical protein